MPSSLPPELLLLTPLAVAAGLDLYLTILVLAAAPTTPGWEHPLPGALGDLDTPWITVVVGGLYLAAFVAERTPRGYLGWNGAHLLVRPLSGALLGMLLLHGQPAAAQVTGALAAGALTGLVHAVRTGATVLRDLTEVEHPRPLLVSLLEDTLSVGLTMAALDRLPGASVLALGLLGLGLPGAASRIRILSFSGRAALERLRAPWARPGWVGGDDLPVGVLLALGQNPGRPSVAIRGTPAGALGVTGLPRFSVGWLVVSGGEPVFVRPGLRQAGARVRPITSGAGGGGVPPAPPRSREGPLWTCTELPTEGRGGGPGRLYTLRSGPSRSSLMADLAGR